MKVRDFLPPQSQFNIYFVTSRQYWFSLMPRLLFPELLVGKKERVEKKAKALSLPKTQEKAVWAQD